MPQQKRLRGLTRAIISSIALHSIVLAGFVVARDSQARPKRTQNVIVTKLVKLGKKRPKELLPRKNQPKPSARKSVMPKVPKGIQPEKKKAQKAKPAVDKPTSKRVLSALERLKQSSAVEDDTEGDPDGVVEGTETDLSQAIVGNRFATEIYRCLKSKYELAGLEPSQVAGKSVSVVLWIAADGSFKDHRIEEGSGIERFDDAVEQAILRCAKVDPPPKSIQKMVLKDGIEVQFQP